MPKINDIAIGQELLNVPMGDMIKQMAFAIADAQFELDESSIRTAELMSGKMVVRDADGNILFFDDVTPFTASTTDQAAKPAWQPRYIDTRVQFGTTTGAGSTASTTIAAASNQAVLPLLAGIIKVASTANFSPPPGTLIVQTSAGPQLVTYTGIDTANNAFTGCSGGMGTMSTGGAVASALRIPNMVSMFELGFSPTFYQFVDTIIEVKIAIKITREQSLEVKGSFDYTSKRGGKKKNSVAVTAHVDATYSNKFSYSAEGSSLLRTKLVPIPPPAVFEERVRALFEQPAVTSG